MKKIKVLLGALALIASLGLIGCNPSTNPAADPTTTDPTTTTPAVFDGNVNLTTLAGYDATAGGIVKDFGEVKTNYETVASFTLSDLGYKTDSGFTKVAVVADVYNGETKYDLASAWGARLMLTIGDTKEYNAGVADKAIAVSDASATLLIQSKAEPVTKVVIKAITFSK